MNLPIANAIIRPGLPVFLLVAAVAGHASAKEAPDYQRATYVYTTGFAFENYEAVRHEFLPVPQDRHWGEHPIIWKHMITAPDYGFDPSDPNGGNFVGLPFHTIEVGDSAVLNAYEASGVFTDPAGQPVDPPGHWTEHFIVDGEQVAILAAQALWHWNTPVYINFLHEFPNANLPSAVGAIDSVTLSTPAGVPHEVCGWTGTPDPNLPPCPGLVIEEIKMTYYSDLCVCGPIVVEYFDAGPLSGEDFVSIYEVGFPHGPVIYDPPDFPDPNGWTPQVIESVSQQLAVDAMLRASDGGIVSFETEAAE